MQNRTSGQNPAATTSSGEVRPNEAPDAEVCIEIVRVLETMQLYKRSPTLDGSIPLRAAQGCKPFLDGNAAGFHLRFAQLAMIEKTAEGASLRMTDEEFDRATRDYGARIEQIVNGGYITPDGYWHRELKKGFAVNDAGTLRLWTGLLVRPVPDVCILVSQSMNRSCPVNVREYVIPGGSGFVPLFLDLDLTTLRDRETWLDVELACLTPLRPGATLTMHALRERPEIGRSFAAFYSNEYFDKKSPVQSTGQYRNMLARKERKEAAGGAECEVIVAGPRDIHRVRAFDSFATAAGFSSTHPIENRLRYAEGGCAGRITGSFDGRAARGLDVDLEGQDEQLRAEWRDLYGEEALGAIAQWIALATANQGPVTDPYLMIQPWLLAAAPEGWSILLESYDLAGLQGMRGVLASDSYHGVLPLWLAQREGEFEIAPGTPLIRIIPVPRDLLKAGFRELPLDQNISPDLAH